MVSFNLDEIVRDFTYSKGSIEGHMRKFSKRLYGEILRINGKNAFEDHPLRIAKEADLLIKDRIRASRVRSAALGHDICEDFKEFFTVYDPFNARPKPQSGIIVLNDLYRDAGEEAYDLLYLLYILTRRDQGYGTYIDNIFLPENPEYIDLHREAGIVKLVDGHVNTDIKEFVSEDMDFKSRKMLGSRVDKNSKYLLSAAEQGLLINPANLDKLADVFLIEQVILEIMQDTMSIAKALTPDINFEILLKKSLSLVYPDKRANLAERSLHEYAKGRLALGSYK